MSSVGRIILSSANLKMNEKKLARTSVLEVANDLFYRCGIRAVGVETIVSQAGVAKISLYRSFPSKDDLITAYLEGRAALFWREWDEAVDEQDDPHAQLLAIMAHLTRQMTTPGYRGCPFINFTSEFSDPAHPGHGVVKAAKAETRRRFTKLTTALGLPSPAQLADSLLLMVEGAFAISQTYGSDPIDSLHWGAEVLINAHQRR